MAESAAAPIIVTDATCDLPAALVEAYDIRVLPIHIHFGEDTYRGGTEMKFAGFQARLAQGDAHPTTSTLSVAEIRAHFTDLNAGARPVLAILLSSKLSQMHTNATVAARQLADTTAITVRDSRTISAELGLQVLTAARAARAGRTIDEIRPLLDDVYRTSALYFCLEDLEFLHRGGRIGLVSYHVARTLGLKPIITVSKEGDTAGTYVPGSERPRSLKAALSAFERAIAKHVQPRDPIRVLVGHGDIQSGSLAEDLKARLVERFHCVQIDTFTTSAVNATHVGPSAVGVAFARGDWPV